MKPSRLIALSVFWLWLNGLPATAEAKSLSIKQQVANQTANLKQLTPDQQQTHSFARLAAAVGDKRVVLLGEQDHGDAATFAIKTDLVQYLHQHHQFDTLVFEEGLINFELMNQAGLDLEKQIKAVISPQWRDCYATQPLWQYVIQQNTEFSRLYLTGMDIYLNGMPARNQLEKVLDGMVQRNQLSTDLKTELIRFYQASDDFQVGQLYTKTGILNLIAGINISLQNPLADLENQLLINTKAYLNKLIGHNQRDQQMANNLIWLMNRYPDRKFMVWAHNAHIANDIRHLLKDQRNTGSMGEFLKQSHVDEVYIVGFTSFEGETGRLSERGWTYPVKKPKRNSLNQWLYDMNLSQAFVDFQILTAKDQLKFHANGIYHENHKAAWHQIYDGIYYLKEQLSCRQ